MIVNNALSTFCVVMLTCMVCYADAPSKEEVANANAVVTDVLAPKIEEMKSGKAKPNEVADYALSLMGEAETPAAKYALAGNAYIYYMKGGEYAKAVEAIGMMREAIPDIPPDRLLKALSPAAKGVSANKAPAVHAILADLQGKVQSQGEITKLTAQIKGAKVSERPMLYRKLGESYAVIGDWTHALENLSKGDGEVAKVAQDEMGNTKSVGRLAGMWWEASEEKGVKPAAASAYRQHAAELYKKGLEDGSITGLSKKVAEQRIEEAQTASCAVLSTETTPKQRVPKGLVHRWSFNGDLMDSVGDCEARLTGLAKMENGCIAYPCSKSNIILGGVTLPESKNITIELWVKPNKVQSANRMFKFGLDKKHRIDVLWEAAPGGGNGDVLEVFCGKRVFMQPAFGPFEMGVEYHLALVLERDGKNYKATAYRQDAKTGKTLSKRTLVIDNDWSPIAFEHKDTWLGGSYWNDDCADACYNEFRIWNRALSKSEIERSAKAGPDKFGF